MRLKTDGHWFIDEHGRRVILHGVNLSGSSKVPTRPDGATHLTEGFFEHKDVSFVGRPFPLEEADEHFRRLKHWGLDFLRFIVTWEAIEHEGPGIYDEAYLDYIVDLLEKAYEHGIQIYIDPHQDVWSRFSGGDGAPAWTFDAIGMDITKFKDTNAAVVHQTYGDPLPAMIWVSNYSKFATMTMFTLFYGGNDFAPLTKVGDVPIQDYLQSHFINAMKQLAKRINHLPNVIGFGTLNEPHSGLIGAEDIRSYGNTWIKIDVMPTPMQGMFLASGFPQDCNVYDSALNDMLNYGIRQEKVNPEGVSVWKEDYECVWKQNGVWKVDKNGEPVLMRPGHFSRANGKAVDFMDDYLRPFARRFASAIHETAPDMMVFVESEPMTPPPNFIEEESKRLVYAPHYYDGLTLFSKQFHPQFNLNINTMKPLLGIKAISQNFAENIGMFRQFARDKMNDVPIVVGEFGIPYDLNKRTAYQNGDFTRQAEALNYYFGALDAHLMNYTIWNYTSDNSNERGDLWNGEDLSIFSRDQQHNPDDINSGGRALSAVVRPYAKKVAGEPLNMRFDEQRGIFTFSFRHDNKVSEPTEIYVPNSQFPAGYKVEVSDGDYQIDTNAQTVIYHHTNKDIPHMIRVVSNTPPPPELSPLNKMAIIAGVFLFLLLMLRGGDKKNSK